MERPSLGLRYDLRMPPFGAAPSTLYGAALEQCAWADQLGFDEIQLSEHHGQPDGYCPAPLVLAAAVGARTSSISLLISALVLPLHDPLKVAEEVAVADLVTGGRICLVLVPGYVDAEFAMFGLSPARRVSELMSSIETLKLAWKGEPFEHKGRLVRVTPTPVQTPRPTMYLGGGTVGAARRAAEATDGMVPGTADPAVRDTYFRVRSELGLGPGRYFDYSPALAVVVTEDPERTWAEVGPHALYETMAYAELAGKRTGVNNATGASDVAGLRATSAYQVVTPDECIALYASLSSSQRMLLHPLVGGLEPEIGWASLQLFADRVLPRLLRSRKDHLPAIQERSR